ncbi:MAG: pilus assembly protein [Actinobacteria bacterium]|nr:pilus assembly protein [Actinomycetota bacterium]
MNRRLRVRDDRGTAIVEAAFVTPVFILMIFGIFEFSGYVMARNGATAAVKAGSRMAVVQGNNALADREILRRMALGGVGADQEHIDRVVIWKASGPSDTVPPACLTSLSNVTTSTVKCNVCVDPQGNSGGYTKAKLPLTTDSTPAATLGPGYADYWFGCNPPGTVGSRLDCGWPPQTRNVDTPSPTNIAFCNSNPTAANCVYPDYVGIYIQVTHRFYTGLFGSTTTVTAQSISAIEPQGYEH